MKHYITWKCGRCNATFEFDAEVTPLRCPDCLSPRENLHRIAQEHALAKHVSDAANDGEYTIDT